LRQADSDGYGPGNLVPTRFAAQSPFHGQEENATGQGRPGHARRPCSRGHVFFANLPLPFFSSHSHREHTCGSQGNGEAQFGDAIARRRRAPLLEQAADAGLENDEDSEDGAALHDDVEQLALLPQPAFRQLQVTGGGDGKKFGDPLDDSQKYDGDPFRHPVVRLEMRTGDKAQIRHK